MTSTTNFIAPELERCGNRGQLADCGKELYHGGFCDHSPLSVLVTRTPEQFAALPEYVKQAELQTGAAVFGDPRYNAPAYGYLFD